MLPKNEPCDPFEWMVVEQSLEEELVLECSIREIEDCESLEMLSRLCVAMARQNFHQGKLLRQAVNRIAEMDSATAMVG